MKSERSMKTKYDIVIAIDPDCEASGVAKITTADRYVSGMKMTFPCLAEYLRSESERAKADNLLLVAVVECSWGSTHNWHYNHTDPKKLIAYKGYSVGRNHETGRKIVEICRHIGIEVVEKSPLVKCWRGKDGKITHDELERITGFSANVNQDVRDAVLLAWDYAGFPMIMRR